MRHLASLNKINDVSMKQPGSVYFFNDFPDKDGISLYKDYLIEIEKIVADWESRFHE